MTVLRGFIKKEIIQMLRNPVMVFSLLIMPIIQIFLFSYAITNEPKNIRIYIQNAQGDYLMNRIHEHSIASGWFLDSGSKKKDPFEAIRARQADVSLVAPPGGLSKNVKSGEATEIQVLIDASNVLRAQSVSGYIGAIISNVMREELSKGHSAPRKDRIDFKTRILFNPQMDTKTFTIPSVLVIIVAMSILNLVCMSIAKEKETGTMETLISAPIEKKHIILGKTVPFIGVSFFNMLSIVLVGILVFKVPFRGSFSVLLVAFAVFTFAMASLGIFMSSFCKNQQQALMFIMIVSFLLMMLSGAMFPVETMPAVFKIFANINPLTHFIYLARNIMLKGGHGEYYIKHILPMLAFGISLSIVGVIRFKQTIQ
jgi:ABC-2 type transport system permease protein